jgi:hypothetical protein
LWAQESIEHDVQLNLANKYASNNYSAYINEGIKTFPCADEFIKVSVLDVYGYVKLMYQRSRLKYKDKVDNKEIVDAIISFKEALSLLGQVKNDICFWQERRKELWESRVTAHLKQAEAMQK